LRPEESISKKNSIKMIIQGFIIVRTRKPMLRSEAVFFSGNADKNPTINIVINKLKVFLAT
jgi:hypothetical protein